VLKTQTCSKTKISLAIKKLTSDYSLMYKLQVTKQDIYEFKQEI